MSTDDDIRDVLLTQLARPGAVTAVTVDPGGLLFVKVGVANLYGAPWIPTDEELVRIRDILGDMLPDVEKYVGRLCDDVLVTHFGIELEALSPERTIPPLIFAELGKPAEGERPPWIPSPEDIRHFHDDPPYEAAEESDGE